MAVGAQPPPGPTLGPAKGAALPLGLGDVLGVVEGFCDGSGVAMLPVAVRSANSYVRPALNVVVMLEPGNVVVDEIGKGPPTVVHPAPTFVGS